MRLFLTTILLCFSLALANPFDFSDKGGGEISGDVLALALPAFAGIYTLSQSDYEGTGQLALSYSTALATVLILKYAIPRPRPYADDLENPSGDDLNSFPSGHTASAFSASSFMWRRYGWKLGVPTTALATYVGVTRMTSDNHHLTDVLASVAISVGTTFIFTKNQKLEMFPILGTKTYGVMVKGKF